MVASMHPEAIGARQEDHRFNPRDSSDQGGICSITFICLAGYICTLQLHITMFSCQAEGVGGWVSWSQLLAKLNGDQEEAEAEAEDLKAAGLERPHKNERLAAVLHALPCSRTCRIAHGRRIEASIPSTTQASSLCKLQDALELLLCALVGEEAVVLHRAQGQDWHAVQNSVAEQDRGGRPSDPCSVSVSVSLSLSLSLSLSIYVYISRFERLPFVEHCCSC